jgi:hypothetical protein
MFSPECKFQERKYHECSLLNASPRIGYITNVLSGMQVPALSGKHEPAYDQRGKGPSVGAAVQVRPQCTVNADIIRAGQMSAPCHNITFVTSCPPDRHRTSCLSPCLRLLASRLGVHRQKRYAQPSPRLSTQGPL